MSEGPLRFGRYLLVELLAEGGMAQVYRALLREASGFEKPVALKRVLRQLGSDPEFIARFVAEARIASRLSHSNIVQVFDFGQVDGEYFLAMELVDGPDLGTLMAACREQQRPISVVTATYVMAEAARGLGAAHDQASPVVHRDVSPQNILISRNGEVKVVDFGIALAAERALRTRTGLLLGKCRYMAPEQARGKPVDPRADVFAAGCVLFELLAGRPLFDGATAEEVLGQVLRAPIPAASSLNPEVPPELDEVLARTLDRRREVRPPHGTALARELEALLHRMAADLQESEAGTAGGGPLLAQDDLAALVNAATPPPQLPHRGLLTSGSGVVDPGLADTALKQWGAVHDSTRGAALTTSAETCPAPARGLSLGSHSEQPSVVGEPAGQASGLGLAGPSGPRPPASPAARPPRLLALLIGAALLGGSAGGLAGLLASRGSSRSFGPGNTVEHEGWKLRLETAERQGELLLLGLAVQPPPGAVADPAAARPRLELDGRHLEPTCYASRADGDCRQWRLIFRGAPRATRALLRVRPQGRRPLLLALEVVP